MTRLGNAQTLTLVAALAASTLAAPAAADQCINDDLIVDGSACIGLDCVCNVEAFSFDTLRLKENNLRITFIDTSRSSSFPRGDWQIRANESTNGGADEFAIDWLGTGASSGTVDTTPFVIEGDPPNDAIHVDDAGRVGFKTAVPAVELHSRDGNTPTLRLEQDGSAGFAPQTWDVAGNESNFFVRDVTNGSQMPLRIRPGADTNSILIDADDDVGIGTGVPDARLHVVETAAGALDMLELTNNGNSTIRVGDSAVGDTWAMVFSQTAGATGGRITMNENAENVAVELTLEANGNLTVRGELFSTTCAAPCAPDYVFEPGYPLMPLAELGAFVAENKHLPNVPSAEELVGTMSVNRMQMRLLEKIEELTLYTLEQQAALEELRAANAALGERLADLERR